MSELVLGPLVRHVDATSATIWVETASAGRATVAVGERRFSAATFGAHGHHYALVEVIGLEPGGHHPYQVELAGEQVWPPSGSELPPSVIATLEPGKPLRMAFGSCRVSVPHDQEGNDAFGVDALRSYALFMAGLTSGSGGEDERWPDLVLFLGDQVYADETSDDMKEFIATRRSLDEPPGEELKDFEEYAHLYKLAWNDPTNRWLLSTLPSAMIFDDHDIRDDWNTSHTWKDAMEQKPWWRDRIVGGLASYWVYQHLGNMSTAERAADPLWQRVVTHQGPDELDITAALDELAERADQEPDSYRWSFARDFDTQARLIVVDSRAARVLDPDNRSILDKREMDWLDEQMQGGFDHLLIGTSLPFLLAPGLHHGEAFSEALAQGAWGGFVGRIGERLRQAADMEHWAAFQQGFRDVAGLVLEVAAGERGRAPRTITFLSGDVHHSYVARARPGRGDRRQVASEIVQAVCSPIRNPLPWFMHTVTTGAARRPVGRLARRFARLAKVSDGPLEWNLSHGPWYDNNLAILELPPSGLRLWWTAGEVVDRPDRPVLRRVATVGPIG